VGLPKPGALLRHSGQGSQYASEQFQRLMTGNGVTCSMSRSGNVWNKAAMEDFFSSLKTKRIRGRVYRTRRRAGPTCSMTSSGSTAPFAGIRPSATSARSSSKRR
jgi:transposase InsO family protein